MGAGRAEGRVIQQTFEAKISDMVEEKGIEAVKSE